MWLIRAGHTVGSRVSDDGLLGWIFAVLSIHNIFFSFNKEFDGPYNDSKIIYK